MNEYTPPWAPHVIGRIGERDDQGEQRIELECTHCKTKHLAYCRTGMPRQHVATFARAHVHRDAFAASGKK